jgi:hypothetical protein
MKSALRISVNIDGLVFGIFVGFSGYTLKLFLFQPRSRRGGARCMMTAP